MKTFLIKYEIRDGEAEYREMAFVKAITLDAACKKAEKEFKKMENEKYEYRLFTLESAQEVLEEEAINALKVYASVYEL